MDSPDGRFAARRTTGRILPAIPGGCHPLPPLQSSLSPHRIYSPHARRPPPPGAPRCRHFRGSWAGLLGVRDSARAGESPRWRWTCCVPAGRSGAVGGGPTPHSSPCPTWPISAGGCTPPMAPKTPFRPSRTCCGSSGGVERRWGFERRAPPPTKSPPRVVIVGGGFAGLYAAKALRGAPVRVTVVDRTNYHLFQPMLYQVATAALDTSDIASPIRSILRRQRNADVIMAEVTADRPRRPPGATRRRSCAGVRLSPHRHRGAALLLRA